MLCSSLNMPSLTLPAHLAQGHGTHVTGSTAGSTYGVAKRATIHSVKTMGDDGSGSYSNIIAGESQGVKANGCKLGLPVCMPDPHLNAGGGECLALSSAAAVQLHSGVFMALRCFMPCFGACLTRLHRAMSPPAAVGMNWVRDHVRSNGWRGVVNMSLGGPRSTALNDAAQQLIAAGIPVVGGGWQGQRPGW